MWSDFSLNSTEPFFGLACDPGDSLCLEELGREGTGTLSRLKNSTSPTFYILLLV